MKAQLTQRQIEKAQTEGAYETTRTGYGADPSKSIERAAELAADYYGPENPVKRALWIEVFTAAFWERYSA